MESLLRNLESEDSFLKTMYMRMFSERAFISTKERIAWCEYISDLGICWDIKLPNKAKWEGWEAVEDTNCYTMRPKGLEDYIKIAHYYIPKDLAFKMLVLGFMP